MAYDVARDITAGPLVLRGVRGSVGAVYSTHRTEQLGYGAAVELPAVLHLLAAIDAGQITAPQAQKAPVMADAGGEHRHELSSPGRRPRSTAAALVRRHVSGPRCACPRPHGPRGSEPLQDMRKDSARALPTLRCAVACRQSTPAWRSILPCR